MGKPGYSKRVDSKRHQTIWTITPSVKSKYYSANKRICSYLKKSDKINMRRKKKMERAWTDITECNYKMTD